MFIQLEIGKWYKTAGGQTVKIEYLHESSGAMLGSVIVSSDRTDTPPNVDPTVWKQNGEHFYGNEKMDIVSEIC